MLYHRRASAITYHSGGNIMRRLWAYILLALTTLVIVGTTFVGEITKVNSNNQFRNGQEITFRVSDKDDQDVEFTDYEAVDNITSVMERRLETAKVTSYEILKAGYDTIKVKLTEETAGDYQNIITYLSFNGNLGLTYGDNALTADEFLLEGKKASIDTYNGYPAILLPVNTESVDVLLTNARDDIEKDNSQYAEEMTGEGDETSFKYYLYLWYDFEEGKTNFEAATNADNPYNYRLLMKFEVSAEADVQYYDDGNDNRLYSLINLDTNSDSVASVKEKTIAYKNARYFVNLINAGAIDYDVQFMYQQRIDATIESLFDVDRLAWNRTLSATLFVLVVLALILVVYYRIAAIAIGTISIAAAYLGLLSTIWFTAEFSIFGVLAVIAVSIASVISGAIYMAKLKNESYRGRSLKKANAEASKKSLLPIIDVNIVVIVFGIFAYIFGGAIFRAFAAITVIGGLASIALNTFGLKGMMWLATNATSLQGKYDMFGINSERVPNLVKEEKQNYFGAYAEKNLTKRSKLVGIISAVLFVISLGGSITFAALNNDNAFVNAPTSYTSQLIFERTSSTDNDVSFKEPLIKEILSHIYLYEEDADGNYVIDTNPLYVEDVDGNPTKDSRVVEIFIPKMPNSIMYEEETINFYYCAVKLDLHLTNDVLGFYNDGTIVQDADGTSLNDNLAAVINVLEDDNTSVSLKSLATNAISNVSFSSVSYAIGLAILVLGVYFMIRYRLSRGIASLVVTTLVSGVVLGILSLLRLPVSSLVLAAVPVAAMFAMMISIIIMNRERELIIDDKAHDASIENRHQLAIKATSFAFTAVSAITIFVGWIALGFFGFGPDASAWIFGLLFLGVVFATWVVTTLLAPISSFFYKLFKKVNIRKPRKKAKKVTSRRLHKSAEPEEAVFIGIND